jgi:hypothetical protein
MARWAKGTGIGLAIFVWLMALSGVQHSNWATALPAAQASGLIDGATQPAGQRLGDLDFSSYCISQGYVGISLDGRTINDWHCVDSAGKKTGLDTGAACRNQYQTSAIGRWDNFNDPFSWSCFALAGGGSTNAQSIGWHDGVEDQRRIVGKQYTYSCQANGTQDSALWGTDVYTWDSRICQAAVHSGLITFANGGTVTIEIVAGQNSYTGSTRNGVTSASWGSYDGSFRFVR